MINNTEETHVLQRSFRAVMDAFARPGSIGALEAQSGKGAMQALPPYFETVVRMFVDQAVSYAVCTRDPQPLARAVAMETHSHLADAGQADYLLLPEADDAAFCEQAVLAAKGGTLLEPEQSAVVVIAAGKLSALPQRGLEEVVLEGPGIEKRSVFYTSCFSWIYAREKRGDEYPCGIDILLVDAEGAIVAVPRTSHVVASESAVREGSIADQVRGE